MPELVNSRVWSPAGTRLALGTAACPRSAKNSTNRRRISAAGMEVMRGSGASSGGGIGRNGTERSARGGSGRREGQERQIRTRAELLRRLSVAEDAHRLGARVADRPVVDPEHRPLAHPRDDHLGMELEILE